GAVSDDGPRDGGGILLQLRPDCERRGSVHGGKGGGDERLRRRLHDRRSRIPARRGGVDLDPGDEEHGISLKRATTEDTGDTEETFSVSSFPPWWRVCYAVPLPPRTYLLKCSSVRDHASFAAASS